LIAWPERPGALPDHAVVPLRVSRIGCRAADRPIGYSSLVLNDKHGLAEYFPAEAPDYVSMDGSISASILIEAAARRR
jgi:hypothetical protein